MEGVITVMNERESDADGVSDCGMESTWTGMRHYAGSMRSKQCGKDRDG